MSTLDIFLKVFNLHKHELINFFCTLNTLQFRKLQCFDFTKADLAKLDIVCDDFEMFRSDQISNKKVKAIYTELRRNVTYSPWQTTSWLSLKSICRFTSCRRLFPGEPGEQPRLLRPCSSESWSPPACGGARRCRSQAACR